MYKVRMVLTRSREHTTIVNELQKPIITVNFGLGQLVFAEVQGKVTLLP